MAVTKRYNPAFAVPGNEAFRREQVVRYRPGLIVVTHPVPPSEPETNGDDDVFPVWFAKGRGGGSSGAPLPPAPAPDQIPEPDGVERGADVPGASQRRPFATEAADAGRRPRRSASAARPSRADRRAVDDRFKVGRRRRTP